MLVIRYIFAEYVKTYEIKDGPDQTITFQMCIVCQKSPAGIRGKTCGDACRKQLSRYPEIAPKPRPS